MALAINTLWNSPPDKFLRSLFFKSENFEFPLLSKPTIVNPFSLNLSKDLAIFVTLIKGIFSLVPTDIFEKFPFSLSNVLSLFYSF